MTCFACKAILCKKPRTSSKKTDNPEEVCSTSTDIPSFTCSKCSSKVEPSIAEVAKFKRDSFVQEILKMNSACFRYTGIQSVSLLEFVFKWIAPSARKNIKLWTGRWKDVPGRSKGKTRKLLTLYQEFLLTLVFLRCGFDNYNLSNLFQVDPTYVSKLCIAWVMFLEESIGQLVRWPDSTKIVIRNMPASFRKYPRTKAIIDCLELLCERPFCPGAQRTTWSSYKHHNTFKFLVSIMPTGAITFVSKLYGGSISDEAIVKSCGFLDHLQ